MHVFAKGGKDHKWNFSNVIRYNEHTRLLASSSDFPETSPSRMTYRSDCPSAAGVSGLPSHPSLPGLRTLGLVVLEGEEKIR